MIVLKQVAMAHGDIELTFQYSDGEEIKTVVIRYDDILDRMRKVKQLLGRQITVQDVREVITQMINELRAQKASIHLVPDFEKWLEVNIE